MQFLQVLDSAMSHLKDRFEQDGLKEVAIVEGVLLGQHDQTSVSEAKERMHSWPPELKVDELLSQPRVFSKKHPFSTLKEACEGFSGLSEDARELLPQVRLLS